MSWRSSLEVFDLAEGRARVILRSDRLIEAPNWHPTGRWLLVNGEGRLWRVPLEAPRLVVLETGIEGHCNNDHGFSPEGATIYFCAHRGHGAEMFRMPVGGVAEPLMPEAPSWWHGVSGDGAMLCYAGVRAGRRVEVITRPVAGGPERRMTPGVGHCDGPDFAADAQHIYYNSDETGWAQIHVVSVDGGASRRLFADDQVNWFPHPSPCGRHMVYLAYPPGTQGHPRDLPVALVLCDPDGCNRRRLVEMTGGQGSLNVPCWAPDGSAFAFIRYRGA